MWAFSKRPTTYGRLRGSTSDRCVYQAVLAGARARPPMAATLGIHHRLSSFSKVRLLRMTRDIAAVVAAAAESRGIGYQGDLVRPRVDGVARVGCIYPPFAATSP